MSHCGDESPHPDLDRSHSRWLAFLAMLGLLAEATTGTAAEPTMYAVDFVSTAARGAAMNDQGMIAGVRTRLSTVCIPSSCTLVTEAVVWSGDTVTPLPLLPGYPDVTAVSINSSGWVAGYAGSPTTTGARAVVWKPMGSSYTAIDLGVLPATLSSWAVGIDDLGRAVGWTTTGGAFPTHTAPFVWTEATGMADLTSQGFPNEIPLAVSPGGTVATPGHWFRLDTPSSVTPLAPPPPGFSGPGSYPAAINDAGDQVRFQISTGTGFLPYLFRYHHGGTWQRVWSLPAGSTSSFGVGSINADGDLTATVGGAGLVAYGPDGLAQPVGGKLSPAYGASGFVGAVGPINASGQILAQAFIGLSGRLSRLVATEPCASSCIRVASIQMAGRMFSVPPGYCTPTAFNIVGAMLTVTDEAGNRLPGATVTGRFLDQYYLDRRFSGTTGRDGTVKVFHLGRACVGTVSTLVEDVTIGSRGLDFAVGELTDGVIPR